MGYIDYEKDCYFGSDQLYNRWMRNGDCKKNDLLLTMEAPLGNVALVPDDRKYILSQRILLIRPNNKISNLYLYYYFMSDKFQNELRINSSGSTAKGIQRRRLEKLIIEFPESISYQKHIANTLKHIDDEINLIKAKISKLKDIRIGIMQKLLSGQIRLVSKPKHNKAINEAVLISVLSHHFGSEKFPLGRKRYTKLSYLFHRHTDGKIEDYVKKAAGPYNPNTKYKGSERIALQKNYITKHKREKYEGFISGSNFNEAENYYLKWYDQDSLNWLLQFKKNRNDYLELIATVDSAIIDLKSKNTAINVDNIIEYIKNIEEWKPKLDRDIFAAKSIENAINKCFELFDY
jgi:type I restriction enzyme S subunit